MKAFLWIALFLLVPVFAAADVMPLPDAGNAGRDAGNAPSSGGSCAIAPGAGAIAIPLVMSGLAIAIVARRRRK
jgi:hypothetical protein